MIIVTINLSGEFNKMLSKPWLILGNLCMIKYQNKKKLLGNSLQCVLLNISSALTELVGSAELKGILSRAGQLYTTRKLCACSSGRVAKWSQTYSGTLLAWI